jgi:hypothetical protein
VFPCLASTNIPFSSNPLKAKYVVQMGKYKAYNSSHAYCQVKGWSKKSYETFSNDFGKGFENGMMEGEKMDSCKKILKLKCFCSLKILTSPFDLQRLLELFFFLPLFSILSLSLSLSFSMLHLFEDLGGFDDKCGEKHSSKNYFEMKWNGMAKTRLWKWGSCGYIVSGCIFQNEVMHTDIIW